MENLTIRFVFGCLLLMHSSSGFFLSAVINVGQKVFDLLELGKKVLDFFQTEDDAPALDRIILEIKDRIDSANTEILTRVLIQSKLDKIDETVITLHSLLIDLDNRLHAKSEKDRIHLDETYVSRFEQHDAIKQIRFLPELLTYQVPGTEAPLKDLYIELIRCNMTALLEFKLFYLKLVSDGIALQLLHLHLTSSPSLNITIERWVDRRENMKTTFDEMEKGCIANFAKYVKEDIQAADDAETLWKDNNERYPWNTNDVLFLKPYGTYQFLYTKHFGDNLFRYRSNKNKIVIFTGKDENAPERPDLLSSKGLIKSAIGGKTDENAAKNVGKAVERKLLDYGLIIRALVVFFDGGEFASDKLTLDDGSSVVRLDLDDVELAFCTGSNFKCAVDFTNLFGGRKDVRGLMKIYAYVLEKNNLTYSYEEIKYVTDSSNETAPLSSICILLMTFCVYWY